MPFSLQNDKSKKGHNSTRNNVFVKHYAPNVYACPYIMSKLERDRTLKSGFNQAIYLKSSISSLSFKALAQIGFQIACSQDFIMSHRLTMHELIKGHN